MSYQDLTLYLLAMPIPGVLAVEAALLVTSTVRHPAVAVAMQATNPAFSVAVATGDTT
jgi:hypothetical protein